MLNQLEKEMRIVEDYEFILRHASRSQLGRLLSKLKEADDVEFSEVIHKINELLILPLP